MKYPILYQPSEMTVYPTGRIVFFDIDGRILYTVKETVDLSLGRNGSTIVFGDLCQITVDILGKLTDGITVYTYPSVDPLANNFDQAVGIAQKTNEVLNDLLGIMKACCGGGGDGAAMLYQVYLDGVLEDEFSAFSTENQDININWV